MSAERVRGRASTGRPARARRAERGDPARGAGRPARRAASMPPIRYPADLPVVERREDIAAAIRDHQVVIVAGETGSGKTTQIPKIALELGRGVQGMIGHTQPRRIAARSVAERLAVELDRELGTVVGYQVRFTDHSSPDTVVKVMTDGILLAELQRDKDLRRYDTLIIDEAHERSLNIDFILGYLRQLLPRRPDLKVVITSATIDPQLFAQHFATDGVPAPIIEVSGRTYPVEVRYRPLVREEEGAQGDAAPAECDIDQVTGICDAVTELWTERGGGPQDILVFLSGEREIRDAADALARMSLPQTAILPLYARLSAAEQHRVFDRRQDAAGRRIVLATNVAETSLTVPGIRYVVDTGTARISRYNKRTKVQRLPIEPVSKASARQRAGRCGRLADGVCLRLYSQPDFEARPDFTDPEILRTSLASVILAMTSLGLGDIARFPFVQPPDSHQILDGARLLEELSAIEMRDGHRRLTTVGRAIAALPVDPRLARMIVEADRVGSLREVLVLAAALSIQDPRERPSTQATQADQAHARFRDDTSDFVSLLNLWRYLKDAQKSLSGSAFRRMCRREYLHYLRVREWQDLHAQLRQAAKSLRMRAAHEDAPADRVHQALLAGLLSQVGLRDADRRDYLGARGAHFGISPGSSLFRNQPQWVMSAELVETTRVWARVNARTDPAWVERAAGHLVKRSYSEPHWERRRAGVVGLERVTLYGLPLVADRKVSYGSVDPELSRDLFIRHALVEGDWDAPHAFLRHNCELAQRLGELEERARRRDLLVDEETLVEFYDQRVPEHVVSGGHFDSWWKTERRNRPDLLTFTEDLLVRDEARSVDLGDYPPVWDPEGKRLPLTYQFEPGADADGVSVHLPLELLNQVHPQGFDWQVPGLRRELVEALLRSLPKAARRRLVPVPDRARAVLAELPGRLDSDRSLTDAMAGVLARQTGVCIGAGEWDWSRVPGHLRLTFRVEDARGRVVGEGKDLADLQRSLAPQARQSMAQVARSLERTGLRRFEIDELPEIFEQQVGGRAVLGYPALVDRGDSVAVEVLGAREDADVASARGVRRLLLLAIEPPWARVLGALSNAQKLVLGANPHGSVPGLLRDALACAVDSLVLEHASTPVRTASAFEVLQRGVRTELPARLVQVVELLVPVLDAARQVELALAAQTSAAMRPACVDLSAQLRELVHDGFVADTGYARLPDLPRYLRAMSVRLDKAPEDLRRDAERQLSVQAVRDRYAAAAASLPEYRRAAEDVIAIGWMIQELRVSLFAQTLGTAYPVSPQRIGRAIAALAG